jgi:thioredoxin-related protein
MLPFSKMKDFFSAYKLDKIPNVIVGQDREFILSTFYKMKSLPFLAFYNKKGKLIDVFEGSLPVNKILEVFKK